MTNNNSELIPVINNKVNVVQYKVDNNYAYFDLFLERRHNSKSNISGNINFPICESILIENGQIYKWVFNSSKIKNNNKISKNKILKKHSNKLNKDTIYNYFCVKLINYFRDKNKLKIKKSNDEIINDISKINLFLERFENTNNFPESLKYLEDLCIYKFIFPRKYEQVNPNPNDSSYFYVNFQDNKETFNNKNFYHSINNINSFGESNCPQLMNIIEFYNIINDSNKLSLIKIIHCFLNVDLSNKPLICRFYRNSNISSRKLQLYTPLPSCENINNIFQFNNINDNNINNNNENRINNDEVFRKYSNNEEYTKNKYDLNTKMRISSHSCNKFNVNNKVNSINKKQRKYADENSHLMPNLENMTLLHNNNLQEYINNISSPFIKLLEDYYDCTMIDGILRFVKVSENNYLFFSCERLLMQRDFTLKNNNLNINKNNINEDYYNIKNDSKNYSSNINNFPNINNINKNRLFDYDSMHPFKSTAKYGFTYIDRNLNKYGTKGFYENKIIKENCNIKIKFPIFGKAKVYEKLRNLSCYGEFCNYNIPKNLKNQRELTEKESYDVKEKINLNNTNFKTINNMYINNIIFNNLNHQKLSYFLIKKIYDNETLVNLLLKAYKIFPPNIDEILKNIKNNETVKKDTNNKTFYNKKTRQYDINNNCLSSIESNTNTVSSFNNITKDDINNNNNTYNIDNIDNNKLYVPTPNKFRHINSDKLYTEVKVCNNCYIIYLLLNSFLKNINEGNSSFKNIEKAKNTLENNNSSNNKNQNNVDYDNKIQNNIQLSSMLDNPDLKYLYKEKSQQLDLKYMLKKQLKLEKSKLKKNESNKDIKDLNYNLVEQEFYKRKPVNSKIKDKIQVNLKSLNMFSYKMQINPKILNFNLAAENKQNKFLKIIFDQIHSNQDELSKHLNVKINNSIFSKSMSALRMHMGINSSSGQTFINNLKNKEVVHSVLNNCNTYFIASKNADTNNTNNNDSEIVNSCTDRDLFSLYSNLLILQSKNLILNSNNNTITKGNQQSSKCVSNYSNSNDLDNLLSKEESYKDSNKKENCTNCNSQNNIIDNNSGDSDSCNNKSFDINNEYKEDSCSNSNSSESKILAKKINNVIKEIQLRNNLKKTNAKTKNYKYALNYRDLMCNDDKIALDHKTAYANIKPSTQSIIYYDWSKKSDKFKQSNYYYTTPISKYNELNNIIKDNMLLKTRDMSIKDLYKIILFGNNIYNITANYNNLDNLNKLSKISMINNANYKHITVKNKTENTIKTIDKSSQFNKNLNLNNIENIQIPYFLTNCKVFVYDQYTAVPYKIEEIYNADNINNLINSNRLKESLSSQSLSCTNQNNQSNNNLNSNYYPNNKYINIIVIALNDFFDSFNKINSSLDIAISKAINENFSNKNNKKAINIILKKIKTLKFNFPAQPYTVFKRPEGMFTYNNIYYAEFLDKFIYYLYSINEINKDYSIMFVGCGNGGHIALTYASLYEKYWSIIHSLVCFNMYIENDEFLNKSMFEILKIIETTGDNKMVDFFIRSITENPNKIITKDSIKNNKHQNLNNLNTDNCDKNSKFN